MTNRDHIEQNNDDNNEWSAKEDLCLKNLKQMRKSEEDMLMFQDEKIALIEQNIKYLEAYISKMSKDLDHFFRKFSLFTHETRVYNSNMRVVLGTCVTRYIVFFLFLSMLSYTNLSQPCIP